MKGISLPRCLSAMLFLVGVGLIYRSIATGPQVFTASKVGNRSEDLSPKELEPTGVPNDERQAIYRTDMTLCEPRTAITRRFQRGAWKAVTYETETLKGSMLYSIPGLASPSLTYALKLQGWHAIYLGQHDSMQRYRAAGLTGSGFLKSSVLKIKLSKDEYFSYIVPEHGEPFGSEQKKFSESDLTESFWRAADLSGQDLILASTDIADANLSYIKLVPLQAEEISRLTQDNQRQDTKRLMAVFDASSMSDWRSRDWILSQLAAFRNSDVGIVLWGTSCGFACYYPTKSGTPPRRQASPIDCYGFSSIYPRSELLLDIKVKGQPIDPLREAVEFAHKLGLPIYASIRPEGPLAPPDDDGAGEFYDKHPQYLCRSREGYPLAHLSLVYPEVRRKWVELLREQIRYGADGASFVFVRGHPFVGYDPPATARFRDQYGVDPTTLEEHDSRWLRLSIQH